MNRVFYNLGIILLVFLFGGCAEKEDVPSTVNKLKLVKKQDYLLDKDGRKIIYSEITEIIPYGNNKLIVLLGREREIYICDMDLNIRESISFKNRDFYFDDKRIISAALKEDSLYLIQNSYFFIIADLQTKELARNRIDAKLLPSFLENVCFLKNDCFVGATNSVRDLTITNRERMEVDKNKYSFGAKYSLNGKSMSVFSLPKSYFDYTDFVEDRSFVNHSSNYVIFSFETSKKVFVYDKNDSLISSFSLKVDKSHWREPGWEFENGKKGYRHTSLMYKPLQTKGDYIYQFILYGSDNKTPDILKYDISGKIIARYTMPELRKTSLYNISIISNRAYIFSFFDPQIYIYENIF